MCGRPSTTLTIVILEPSDQAHNITVQEGALPSLDLVHRFDVGERT